MGTCRNNTRLPLPWPCLPGPALLRDSGHLPTAARLGRPGWRAVGSWLVLDWESWIFDVTGPCPCPDLRKRR